MPNDKPEPSPGAVRAALTGPPPPRPEEPPDDAALAGRRKNFAAVTKKWTGSDVCPICSDTEWVIGNLSDLPIRLPGSEVGTVSQAAHVLPLVPVTCITCGYTRLFHEAYLFNEEDLELAPEDIVERAE